MKTAAKTAEPTSLEQILFDVFQITPADAAMGEQLSDAYSSDTYLGGFAGCVSILRRNGYKPRQIEAILRSKLTRWAADEAGKGRNALPVDLMNFLAKQKNLAKQVAELVDQTFAGAR